MANSRQATKRARQAVKRREHNMSQRSNMRTYVKNVVKAIAAGQLDQAKEIYKSASSSLDKLAHKGIIHKNKAARLKQRLNKKLRIASTAK